MAGSRLPSIYRTASRGASYCKDSLASTTLLDGFCKAGHQRGHPPTAQDSPPPPVQGLCDPMQRIHRMLGLQSNVAHSVLKRHYLQAVLRTHPDTHRDARHRQNELDFLAVQAAWEDYERTVSSPEVAADHNRTEQRRQATDEALLFILQSNSPWLEKCHEQVRQACTSGLREAVTASIREAVTAQTSDSDTSGCTVRRVEFSGSRVDVHVRTTNAAIREAVCKRVDGGCASLRERFTLHLTASLRAIGWPVAHVPLTLRACLPYTQAQPQAPSSETAHVIHP